VITKEEAEKRARQRIQSIRERYSLSHLEINKQKAIVSFVYNIGSLTQKQQWLLNNEYYRAL
jgi:GH24 family phage-related lysozyme (muramidase)